ncbi:MAG TPA: NADH-quinone oxidoreductase subunit N [Pseudomonadales bacterium]
MTALDFQALAMLIALGGGLIVLLLAISFRRNHRLAQGVTIVTLLMALLAAGWAADAAPRAVTRLLAIDGYAVYLGVLFVLATLVVTVLSHRYLHGSRDDPEEFYLLLLAATLGAVTLAAADHFASLLLGLEILSVALYVLIAYPQAGSPPLEASLKYLVLSGAASTTLLFGMALVYVATGSLGFAPLPEPGEGGRLYVAAGLVMIFAGVGFKLSLVPFHMWTPDVYQGAPAPVTAFLATVSKGAVFAFLLRYLLETGVLVDPAVVAVLVVLAVASMIVGNLLALRQEHLKRVLAYSAIAHLGYLLIPPVALGLTDPGLGVEASLVYLGAYFAMTLAAFAVVCVLSGSAPAEEADHLRHYEGLFWHRPGIALVLTVALLSLAGIPLTVGFIAKFYLFAAGVSAAAWLLLGALIVGSGIGLYYYLRIVFAMTRSTVAAEGGLPAASVSGRVTLGVLGALVLLLGVYPAPFINAVRQALAGWSG